MGGMGGRSNKPVDNKEFYELLGVPQDVDAKTLKKSFRKLALKHHPDRGGDENMFKKISVAYEVLSDPEKRATYDKHGTEGLQGGGGGGGGDDLFSMFFGGQGGGGGRGGGRSRGPEKGKTVQHQISVSLEDMYKGKLMKISVNRQRIKVPEGTSKAEAIKPCQTCNGRGAVVSFCLFCSLHLLVFLACSCPSWCRCVLTSLFFRVQCMALTGTGGAHGTDDSTNANGVRRLRRYRKNHGARCEIRQRKENFRIAH